MTKTTNYITGIALAVAFLVAAHVKADTVYFNWTYATGEQTGVASDLQLLAESIDGGVKFTFKSSYTEGDYANGVGRVVDGLGIYGTNGVFGYFPDAMFSNQNGDLAVKSNYNALGKPYVNGEIYGTPNLSGGWFDSDSNPGMDYFAWAYGDPTPFNNNNGSFELSWAMAYGAEMTWEDFLKAVADDFRVGTHLNGLAGGDDAMVYTGYGSMDAPGQGGTPAPEPATLAVLGMGLAGLGLVSRRRRK